MLEANDLSKWFGGNPVLKNISFKIEQGEVVGLIGPNGAGKTTLFNVITGFYRSKTGFAKFNDKDITRMKPENIYALRLCRTFQITKPFSNISVLKNVMIGALSHIKSIMGARIKAEEVLDFVGMLDKRSLLGRNLTIADRKRLEIARGLATSPQLFLLDEVMAGLNPNELNEFLPLVQNLTDSGITLFVIERINSKNVTILLVEQNVVKALNMTDRAYVIENGRLVMEGTGEDLLQDDHLKKAYLGIKTIRIPEDVL